MNTSSRRLMKHAAGYLAGVVLLTATCDTTAVASEFMPIIQIGMTGEVLSPLAEAAQDVKMQDTTTELSEDSAHDQIIEAGVQAAADAAAQDGEAQQAIMQTVSSNSVSVAAVQEERTQEEQTREEMLIQEDETNSNAAVSAITVELLQTSETQTTTVQHTEPARAQQAEPTAVQQTVFAAVQQSEQSPAMAVTENDLNLLAALIQCEAGGEPYIGQVAVGNVVMNRMEDMRHPSTVSDVIYEPGQFTPVRNGSLARTLASGNISESCRQAALEAVAGSSPAGESLFFRRVNGRHGLVIGNHVFY